MTEQLQAIQSKIYTLRGVKVMLDRDLAEMYGVETRVLKQAVRRNAFRFPDDFMFQLSEREIERLVSQNVIPSKSLLGGALPFAFTEQGVAMLSSVLKSRQAVEVNIAIMRAFVTIRQALSNTPVESIVKLQQEMKELKQYMDEILTDQNDINEDTRLQLELINQTLAEMQVDNKTNNYPRRRIGYTQ